MSKWLIVASRTVATLCVVLCTKNLAAQENGAFVIAPYLQDLGQKEVSIRFETADDTPASLWLREHDKPEQRDIASSSHRVHSIKLRSLLPGTTYDYKVRSGKIESPLASFTTAPENSSKPFSFLVYGDSRSRADAHKAIVAAMTRIPASFVLGTGDVVMSGADRNEWLQFFSIEAPLLRNRCLFSAIGNHELDGRGTAARAPYLRYFGTSDEPRSYFSFRWGNSRFFVLDAMDEWTGEQAKWFRSELEHAVDEPDLVHRFVVLHHSPFSSGPHGPNEGFRNSDLFPLLKAKKVEFVLGGHDHIYERGERDGLKFMISGGAGAPLYSVGKKQPGSENTFSTLHFVEFLVDGARVNTVVRGVSGEVLESCGYEGRGAWECGVATGDASPGAADKRGIEDGLKAARPPRCGCEFPGERAIGPRVLLGACLLGLIFALHRRTCGRA